MENSSSQPVLSPLQQQAQLRRKIFSVGIGMLLIGALGVGLFVFFQGKGEAPADGTPSEGEAVSNFDDVNYQEKDLTTLTGVDRFPEGFPKDFPIDPSQIVQSFSMDVIGTRQSSVVVQVDTLNESLESLFEEYFKQNSFTFTPSETDEFPRSFKANKVGEEFHMSLFEEGEYYIVFVTRILLK
jgi:hypothetical protein